MKKKGRKKRCGVWAFFLLLFFGGIAFYVYADTTITNSATNIVTVGKVDVELAMATHDAGTIVPCETAISNEVTVSNVGEYPAYIRMFVKKYWVITEGGTTLTPEQIDNRYSELSVDAIEIQLEEGWTKGEPSSSYSGYDCYYYNEVVDTDKNEVDAIHFSASYQLKAEQTEGDGGITNELLLKFTKNSAKVDGYYSVIVEAIQADTCIPVISQVDGNTMITDWNDTPSTLAPLSTVYIDPSATPVGVVNFKSENTEISNADKFINVESLLPGETAERIVEILNSSSQELPIYVYAESAEEYDTLSNKQKEWLKQLQLVVGKEDGTVLYQNSLYKPNSDEPMLSESNSVLIGYFPPNTSQKLYVSISCPASWTESQVTVRVNWIFASQKALATNIPSSTRKPSLITTDAPSVTEEPAVETSVPEETDVPDTTTPQETLVHGTDDPNITEVPSMPPKETSIVVTESPVYDPKKTVAPTTQEPEKETLSPTVEHNIETPEPVTPEPSDGIESLASEEADTPAPIQSPVENDPTDDIPKKTSTPKQPTVVEELYPTKTGDVTPIVVWLVLFVVSLIGMIFAVIVGRKSR